jgi:hypothetical protein
MAFEKMGDLSSQITAIQYCRQAQSGGFFDFTFIDELRNDAILSFCTDAGKNHAGLGRRALVAKTEKQHKLSQAVGNRLLYFSGALGKVCLSNS